MAVITIENFIKFVDEVEEMRSNQIGFFKNARGSAEKQAFLISSRKGEKRVDSLIKIIREAQKGETLF